MITHILLRIEHTKPLPDLLDLAAGRVYTLSGVSDVTAAAFIGASGVELVEGESAVFRKALEQISAIKNEEYGGDWDEIERAREIANAALSTQPKEIQK